MHPTGPDSHDADSVMTSDPAAVAEDLPVTVIGGYLGSGKTTLVNHVLRGDGGERLAVLVNDFGDVDIDAHLIEHDDGRTIALANGCICCSLVDGLAAALDSIVSFEPRPDRVLVEASGVADPAAVAAYGHRPGLTLDAVVVLVDAETIERRAVDPYVGDTVRGQLRAADVLVVNKRDLVGAERAAAVADWLRAQVDDAVIVATSHARVDPALLVGRLDADRTGPAAGTPAAPPALHDDARDRFRSWTWERAGGVDREAIEAVMADLPESVVRAKGIVWIADRSGRPRPMVVQRVGRRWTLRPARSGSPAAGTDGHPRRSRLVAIGHPGALPDRWLADRLGD